MATAHGQAVWLAYGGTDDYLEVHIEVGHHLFDNQHLLGVHSEIHKYRGSLVRAVDDTHGRRAQHWRSITGLIERGFLDPATMADRHEEVAWEMRRRGMNHKSPLGALPAWHGASGRVDPKQSRKDLAERCPACRARMALLERRS